MSEVLKDFKGKLTPETWCVIEAESRVTGETHAAIVREVLHGWASKKINIQRLTERLLEAEGSGRKRSELT